MEYLQALDCFIWKDMIVSVVYSDWDVPMPTWLEHTYLSGMLVDIGRRWSH